MGLMAQIRTRDKFVRNDLRLTVQAAPLIPVASSSKNHWRSQLEEQFKDWTLSKSEAEVAEALLEGMSLKEIASKRFTSEKTIRNQCRNIYAKSGTTGRHELAAYFLKKSRR